MKKVVQKILSFVLVVSIGLSSVGTRALPEKLAAVSVFSWHAEGVLPRVEAPLPSYQLWLFFVIFVLTGCSVPPTKENIHRLTAEIRGRIKAGEKGNSYGIVDLIDERRELIRKGDFRREDVVGDGGLGLKGIAKKIYLEFGITVEGASEGTLLQVLDLLRILPPEHAQLFHGLVFNVDYNAFYDHDAGGRYYAFNPGIASFKKGRNDNERTLKETLAHELGHGVHLEGIPFLKSFSYWWMHFALSLDDKGYGNEYSKTNHWEDFAEMYERWVFDTLAAIEKFQSEKKRGIVFEKMLFVAKQFLFKKNEKFYLRVYNLMTYEDILLKINNPEELELSHLFNLKSMSTLGKAPFSFSKNDVKNLRYEELYFLVPNIIQQHDTEVAAELFVCLLDKIKEDPRLTRRQKQKLAQDLICRIRYGLFSDSSSDYRITLLRNIQNARMNSKKEGFAIEPELTETFEELEAFFFLEPAQFRAWLIENMDAALKKISALFGESLDAGQYQTFLSLVASLQKKSFKEAFLNQEPAFEFELLAEILLRKEPEVLKNIIEQNKTLKTALITPNQYKLLEKLFDGDKEKVYETIFFGQGESHIEKSYDLIELILDSKADWEKLRAEKAFLPYLKKLQQRFSGITIAEVLAIITSIKKRGDDLTEEKLFPLFLLLEPQVENFVKLFPDWFLNRSKNQESMNPFFKLIALNKISPKYVQLFFSRLISLELFPLWVQGLQNKKAHPEVENLIPAMEKALLQKGFRREQLRYWKEKTRKEAEKQQSEKPDTKQSKLNQQESLINSSL